MKDHALIGKFLGFWPTEKALQGWIASKWKPKGQVTLLLGPKGFFTAIFSCLEDKSHIFEGGPYFFNSSGLFRRDWKPRFNLDTEDLSHAPVWIHMYSLPAEYWKEETLKDIGNSIGVFIKVAKETKNRRYTSYARICVQMHLTKALAYSVSLFHDDFEWIQPLDYEHIPFRCRKCHEHGHLFRECPLNTQIKSPANEASKDSEGFTKVPNRRRHAKKHHVAPSRPKKAETHNRFQILTPQDPSEKQHNDSQASPSRPSPSQSLKSNPPPSSSKPSSLLFSSESKKPALEDEMQPLAMELDAALALSLQDDIPEECQNIPTTMEEDPETVSLEGLDILKLETACKQKEYNSIPPWEIDRLEGVLTKAQHNKFLDIQAGSP